MDYRIMKSKVTKLPKLTFLSNREDPLYKYTFKRVKYYNNDPKEGIESYNVRPITLEAYSKFALLQLLNDLADALEKPVVNEEILCQHLGEEYIEYSDTKETAKETASEYISALPAVIVVPSDDIIDLAFNCMSETDELIYELHIATTEAIKSLKAARAGDKVDEEETKAAYEEFYDTFSLLYEQYCDMIEDK